MEKVQYIKSDILKFKILKKLLDKENHTPSELAIGINTNGTTILRNCKILELLELIEIDVKKTTNINYYLKITIKGFDLFQKNREEIEKLIKF